MKVILLAATPPPIGGIATWTLRMLDVDPSYGCEFYLVDEKMIGGRDMFGNNKRSLLMECKRSVNIWRDLLRKLRTTNADIVQACIASTTLSMMRELVCAYITKFHRKKFIMHFHCTVPNTRDSILWKGLVKKLCKMSNRIFVLNNQSEEFLRKFAKVPIEIIPNFVEADEIVIDRQINQELKTVLYVGGVVESKGVLDIIETAKLCPDIVFRLVGNPEQKVVDCAREIKNVVITGPLQKSEVTAELRGADVFMFLSKFKGEGFSVALLEAMSAGLPCIVSDWAANKDMIGVDGGIVLSKVTPETIRDALHSLEKIDVRKSCSRRNIHTVKNNYTADKNFKKICESYSDTIQ